MSRWRTAAVEPLTSHLADLWHARSVACATIRSRSVSREAGARQRSLAVGLVSFLLGGVVTVGALIALTGTRDPGSPECRSAFTASSEGERTPALRKAVRTCAGDAW